MKDIAILLARRKPCLSSLCPELILMILKHCGPIDLIILSQLSLFRPILLQNPHCWETSRAALGVPKPGHGFSEAEHAKLLFAGGDCTVCTVHTDEHILSFMLNIRCCVGCRGTVFRKARGLRTITSFQYVTTPAIRLTPCQLVRTGFVCRNVDLAAMEECLLRLRDTDDPDPRTELAIEDMVTDRIEDCANLGEWQEEYINSKAAVAAKNMDFLRRIGGEVRRKYTNLLQSPTLCRVVNAFGRDLTSTADALATSSVHKSS
ncbi:hypothetical protein C8R45DRAFT_965055 [Mycena sanguinolenta]|nr:hypothetical protein C8R45DRAFT_965055 [Mycena sanguinolenta]